MASFYGEESIVRLLVDAKMDVNAKNNAGETALKVATEELHFNVVQILKKVGAF